MNYAHPELRDRLAAEYALGTLRGGARRRFERLLSGDASLRELVQGWEMRVNLLAESAPAVPPPARVWEGIAQRIGPAPAPAPVAPGLIERLWDSLGFWRGASLLAAGAAAALAVFIALRPPAMGPEQVAALDQRLAGIETKLAAVESTPREIGAVNDRLAQIEDATKTLAQTPDAIAALGDRLAQVEQGTKGLSDTPRQIAALGDRMAGIESATQGLAETPGDLAALDERLARIEGATGGLAQTPKDIAAISDRLIQLEKRLSFTAPPASHVAVLIDKYDRPMMTADLDVKDGQLVLRLKIKPPRDFTGKALEVWMLPPGNAAPRSLGTLPSEESGTTAVIPLPPEIVQLLASPDSALAVSLEPKGGSSTGQPTGPVLFSGGVVPVDL
jgi:anti-sigma-K factor RskA